MNRVCHCGHTNFKYIGIQKGGKVELKLYNCLGCHTTVAKKIDYKNQLVVFKVVLFLSTVFLSNSALVI